jgi:hypothetical protein
MHACTKKHVETGIRSNAGRRDLRWASINASLVDPKDHLKQQSLSELSRQQYAGRYSKGATCRLVDNPGDYTPLPGVIWVAALMLPKRQRRAAPPVMHPPDQSIMTAAQQAAATQIAE